MTKTNSATKFVTDFLKSNEAESNDVILEKWQSESVQKQFKKNIKIKPTVKEKIALAKTKPKKNQSSYMLFLRDFRDKVKKDNPGIITKNIVSKVAELWNETKKTNPELVDKYDKLAEKDKERYKLEMIKHNENLKVSVMTEEVETKNEKGDIDNKNIVDNEVVGDKEDNEDTEDNGDKGDNGDKEDKEDKEYYTDESEYESDRDSKDVRDEYDDDSEYTRKKEDNSSEERRRVDSEDDNVSDEESESESEYENRLREIKAYHVFLDKKYSKLKDVYPEISSKEIKDLIHRAWDKLSSEKKSEYIERYA